MQQLSKRSAVLYHLYPGALLTAGFVLLAPVLRRHGYPPQLALLLGIVLIALPVFWAHLRAAGRREHAPTLRALLGYHRRLPTARLLGYSVGLVAYAFLVWGATQPLDQLLTRKLLAWLPAWYTVQDLRGYSAAVVRATLGLNLLLNGLLAPVVEEIYFRGYLLPRMNAWGKAAVVANAFLFALYHFWQPGVYLTLFVALLPLVYAVWRLQDLRLAVLTHCLLNLTGALLSFGQLAR